MRYLWLSIIFLVLLSFHRGWYVLLNKKMKTNYFLVKIILSSFLACFAVILFVMLLFGSFIALYIQDINMLVGIIYGITLLRLKIYLLYIILSVLVCSLVEMKNKRKTTRSNK
jgi:hypothetical protein